MKKNKRASPLSRDTVEYSPATTARGARKERCWWLPQFYTAERLFVPSGPFLVQRVALGQTDRQQKLQNPKQTNTKVCIMR